MKRNKINGIGEVNMSKVSMYPAGMFTVHIGFDDIGKDADVILEECERRYKERYPQVDAEKDTYFDFNIVHNMNLECEPEFTACVYIWQKSDEETGVDTCECYEDFILKLDDKGKDTVKRIIWQKLGESLFNLQSEAAV